MGNDLQPKLDENSSIQGKLKTKLKKIANIYKQIRRTNKGNQIDVRKR